MADQVNPPGNTGTTTQAPPVVNTGAPAAITITPELQEWAAAKGYKDFGKLAVDNPEVYRMATSYRETEKFIGGDKIPLPKDMNDEAALRGVFEKLGTPKDAKEYKLSIPQGQPDDFANAFRGAAHDANLTQGQASKLNTWWNGMVDGLIKNDTAATAERAKAEQIGLEKDWGGNFQANKEVSIRAQNMLSSELGIPRDKLTDGLEETFGLRDAMRILHFLGNKAQVTGDTFEGADHGTDRGGTQIMSAENAKQEKQRLLSDPKFASDYRKGDATARGKLAELNNYIAGEMPAQPVRVTNGNPGKR